MPSAVLKTEFRDFQAESFNENLERGQPSDEQFRLAKLKNELALPDAVDGYNLSNYPSDKRGLPSVRAFFAEGLECKPEELLIHGNSLLALMGQAIDALQARGGAWHGVENPKILMFTPGYDRHFGLFEKRGIEVITLESGFDGKIPWDQVEAAVADPSVLGILDSRIYSNPSGYSSNILDVRRMTEIAMHKASCPGFRVLADIAYRWHVLRDSGDPFVDAFPFLGEAHKFRLLEFFSTSKVTEAGEGLAIMRSSEDNLKLVEDRLDAITDRKRAQVREMLYLKAQGGIPAIMQKQRELIEPRLDGLLDIFEKEGIEEQGARFSQPKGGYFVSLWTPPGTATKLVSHVAQLGLKLTKAGAGYPGDYNPQDNHVRIAFTRPSVEGIKRAAERVAHAVRWVTSQ